ncbi:DUF308 domain-containing protein [Salinirubellus salinus]|uniref:DUF308 domain-containing protein n=1 Tax=Salinirubellus salinus TaxID=1364945 RepID=A0A9E7QZU6_9EURY|nr:DUF308 domain-containing protein [Salinirubellus salinus]UWM53076.1 DUF308 domain-containing protein [Salinirubellus salinus]
MSTDTSAGTNVGGLQPVTRDQANVLVGAGVVIAIVGLLALVFPLVSGVTISIIVGAALVVGGLGHVASAFTVTGWRSRAGQLLLALVYAVFGILALANPVLTLTTLTILLVAYFLLEGVVLLALGLINRGERNWVLTVVSGAFSLLVALLVWLGLPSSAAWAIGVLFGANLLVTGGTMVVIGRGYWKAAPTETGPATGSETGGA